MTAPPNRQPDQPHQDSPGSRPATTPLKLAIAVGALLLLAVVILHLTGVLTPGKLH